MTRAKKGRTPITPLRAIEVVLSSVRPLKPCRAAVADALHCRLAEVVRSDRDQPPTDRSAMDGYAVISEDAATAPARLRLIGEVAAGSAAPGRRLRPGTCTAILTGAPVPRGADAVVPVEHTRRDGAWVTMLDSPDRGDNIRRRGEEGRRGAIVLGKGCVLGPAAIGVLAMVGRTAVKVHPLPRVSVVSTGAEVRDAGERVAAHQLRDANGPALVAALAAMGISGAPRSIVPDNPAMIAARLKRDLLAHNVVIVTGGVSVGRYDFVPEAVRRVGGRIRYHGVRMRPGRPQLYSTLPGNRHIFGLPGNPVSVLTGFHEMVLPALARLAGAGLKELRPAARVRLASPVQAWRGIVRFVLVRLIASAKSPSSGATGRTAGGRRKTGLGAMDRAARGAAECSAWMGPAAEIITSAGSADIIAAAEADGVVVIPEGTEELAVGTMVEFHPWRRIL